MKRDDDFKKLNERLVEAERKRLVSMFRTAKDRAEKKAMNPPKRKSDEELRLSGFRRVYNEIFNEHGLIARTEVVGIEKDPDSPVWRSPQPSSISQGVRRFYERKAADIKRSLE